MSKIKTIAALGAAAVTAALPMAGAFAANGPVTSHTDTINLTINSVCTLGTVAAGVATDTDATTHAGTGTGSFTGAWTGDTLARSMQPGTVETLGSTTFTIRCNNAKGFALKAAGAGATGHETSLYKAAGTGTVAAEIATGTSYGDAKTAADGESYWGFKFSGASSGMTIATNYDSLHAIPSEATPVTTTAAVGDLTTGQSVTVEYTVGLDNQQDSGDYTGAVEYTLVENS